MRLLRCAAALGALVSLVVACSSSSSTSSSSSGGSSSGGSASGSSGSSSGSSGADPAASTTAAPVVATMACPTFAPCGGALSGTYDYTGGCVGDVFAATRMACPTLDTSGLKVTVTGSIYFLANSALHRNVKVDIGGSITIPESCAAGQCAAAQTELQMAGVMATCTGSTSCTCTITKTETSTASTTFTISGNTVTTADGDTYDFCVMGSGLAYKGNAGSEDGQWQLKQR